MKAQVLKLLIDHEEMRALAYDDATGKTLKPGDVVKGNVTAGIGINLSSGGLSEEEQIWLCEHRIDKATDECRKAFPWFNQLNDARRGVLVMMVYNMGLTRVRRFPKMLEALEEQDFWLASCEMLASKWAVQVGQRARDLARIMRSGKF